MGLALTWPRSKELFHFYRPPELPSYDARLKKSFTINSDTEELLKIIINLIPEQINPSNTNLNINEFNILLVTII